jgi:hypothetical protein
MRCPLLLLCSVLLLLALSHTQTAAGLEFYLHSPREEGEASALYSCLSQAAESPLHRVQSPLASPETGLTAAGRYAYGPHFPFADDLGVQAQFEEVVLDAAAYTASHFMLQAAVSSPGRVASVAEADVIVYVAPINEIVMAHQIVPRCGGVSIVDRMSAYDAEVRSLLSLANEHQTPLLWMCAGAQCGANNAETYANGLWSELLSSPLAYFAVSDVLQLAVYRRMHVPFNKIVQIPYSTHPALRRARTQHTQDPQNTQQQKQKQASSMFYAMDKAQVGFKAPFAKIDLMKLQGNTWPYDNKVALHRSLGKTGSKEELSDAAFQRGIGESEFCFVHAVQEKPMQRRLFDAVVAGCIPVLITSRLQLPFTNQVDWGAALIMVPEAMWIAKPATVIEGVKSMPTEARARLRKKLDALWPQLDFAHAKGSLAMGHTLAAFAEAQERRKEDDRWMIIT